MTELPRVLELLHDADESFATVAATIRKWQDDEREQQALRRLSQDSTGGSFSVTVYGPTDEGSDGEVEDVVRVWLQRPNHVRIETGGRWPSLQVSDGRTTWSRSEAMGTAEVWSADGPLEDVPMLLRPAGLMSLQLEVGGRERFLGANAFRVRARPRAGGAERDWVALGGWALGADAYDVIVDAERGILLRAAALLDGEEFAVMEMAELDFDRPLDARLFRLEEAPGEGVRGPGEAFPPPFEESTIPAVAAAAPFTVFVPTGLGAEWEASPHFQLADEQFRLPPSVTIHYTTNDGDKQFTLVQRSRDTAAGKSSDELLIVFDGDPITEPISVELAGTSIDIQGGRGMDRNGLQAIAASLAPASTEPPPLRA